MTSLFLYIYCLHLSIVCYLLFIAFICLLFFCIYQHLSILFYFYFFSRADVGENWAFASKLSDLSENFDEDGGENGFSDLDIFTVKFLGSTSVKTPKSEIVTANAIKNIISTAKGECPACVYAIYHSFIHSCVVNKLN